MSTLNFTALKNGSTIADNGLIKLGYIGGFTYSTVLTINPLQLVKRIKEECLISFTGNLCLFVNTHLNGALAIMHFFEGSTEILNKTVTVQNKMVSIDLSTIIIEELERYDDTGSVNNRVLTINISVQGAPNPSTGQILDSYIELFSPNNSDTMKRPHLGIKPPVDIFSDKNINIPFSSPFIGKTIINPNVFRIRHDFELFRLDANSLTFNLSLLYDSYFLNNPNSRPQRFNFGFGYNLNIDEYIEKNNGFYAPFGDKGITLFDAGNNKIRFKQKWYYINGDNEKVYFSLSDPNYYHFYDDTNTCVIVNNQIFQAKYEITNCDGSLFFIEKYHLNNPDELYDKIIDLNGYTYYFNDDCLLFKIEDKFSNMIEITSTTIISSIMIDSIKTPVNIISFNPESLKSSITLSIPNSNYSNSITITYDSVTNLSSISKVLENNENSILTISYNSSGLLSSINSSMHYILVFSYDYGKINQIHLESTIDTISSSITTTSRKTLINYEFYDLGDIQISRDTINNIKQKYILDYDSRLLKTETKDYDLSFTSHSIIEMSSNGLIKSLFNYTDRESNLVKTVQFDSNNFISNTKNVLISNENYKKKETLVATLDLSDVDDSLLLKTSIDLIIKTYDSNNNQKKEYSYHLNRGINSIIGILFYIHKDYEYKYTITISSSNYIFYPVYPTIKIYRCNGVIMDYDIFGNIIKTETNNEVNTYSYYEPKVIENVVSNDIFLNQSSKAYSIDDNTKLVISDCDSNGFTNSYQYDSSQRIKTVSIFNSSNQSLKKYIRHDYENGKAYEISDLKNDNNQFVEAKNTYYFNTNVLTKEKLFNGYNITHTLDSTTLNTRYKTVDSTLNDAVGYTYNHSLLMKVTSYSGDNEFSYKYDNKLRRKWVQIPNGTIVTKEYTDNFNYSNLNIVNGSKIQINYPNNYNETAYFNKLGRIKRLEKSNLYNLDFTYNSKDQLSNIYCYNKMESFNYSYDNYDRLTSISKTTNGQYPVSQTNTYTNDKLTNVSYNINGLTSEYYSYHTSNGYNKDLLSSSNISNLIDINFSYDSLRRLTYMGYKNHSNNVNIASVYYYYKSVNISDNQINRLPLISSYSFTPTNQSSIIFDYDYDVMGNIKSIRKNNTLIHEYEFDSLNRLKIERNNTVPTQNVYTYDARGNITQKKIQAILSNGNTTDLQTKNYSYNNQYWKDLLTGDGTYTYTYDSLGRMTSYKGNTLTWNNDSTLSSYGSNVSYNYDSFKVRKSKTVNNVTTTYYYLGDKLLREVSPNKDLLFYYNGDGVIGFRYNNNDYIYHKNIQGDILEIYKINSYGLSKVAEYSYDAFGNTSETNLDSDNIGDINPFRYRSYYYDSETELYYLITRYYSPYLMRFISPDSLSYITDNIGDINACNLFIYCNNNPIMYADPVGNSPFWLLCALFFALTGYILLGVKPHNDRGNPLENVKNGLLGAAIGFALGASIGLFGAVALTGYPFASTEAVINGFYGLLWSYYLSGAQGMLDYLSFNFDFNKDYFPVNNGFELKSQYDLNLQEGTIIQRYGGDNGKFVSLYFTDPFSLSLPYDKIPYIESPSLYVVIKETHVTAGPAAPWFGQPGGGTQYMLDRPIKDLLGSFLKEFK